MSGVARESARERPGGVRERPEPPGREPAEAARLEAALVLECVVAFGLVVGRTHLAGGDVGPWWAPLGWALVLVATALIVPRRLARSAWGARVARHAMAGAFTVLAVFQHAVSARAFPLGAHLVVIALLMTVHRDPSVVVVVGLVAGTIAVAHDLWAAEGAPLLDLPEVVWTGAAILLVASHTEHARSLGVMLAREHASADDARASGPASPAEGRDAVEHSQWLAALSHELRTPLHAVVGFLELLEGSPLLAEQKRYVEGANTSAQHVLGLVADVLETAKIESGALELEREAFDVVHVVRDAAWLLEGTARERGVALQLVVSDDLHTPLLGDALRLRQILINLLANAVKYARSRVVVRAKWAGETDALQIDVDDDGPGLPEGAEQRVFQPYRQGDRATARRHGGTGLGLAISRSLARLMLGDVVVRSTSPTGTTFRFFAPLPRAQTLDPAREDRPAAHVPPLRVLLADDDASNRLVTSELLRLLGHAVTSTEDGPQAFEQALRAQHDLLVLDVEMPGLSGPEVARRVRAAGSAVPIVGLTGHGGRDRRLTYLRAGMDAVVVKPADTAHLRDAISAALASRASTSDPRPARGADASTHPRSASLGVMRELGSGLDLDDLRQRVGGDESLAAEVLVAVRDESTRLFGELGEAAARGDLEQMRIVAHTLKGCVANVGARPVREAVTAVENAAKSGEREHAVELVTHALVLGESLASALAHACGSAETSGPERAAGPTCSTNPERSSGQQDE